MLATAGIIDSTNASTGNGGDSGSNAALPSLSCKAATSLGSVGRLYSRLHKGLYSLTNRS